MNYHIHIPGPEYLGCGGLRLYTPLRSLVTIGCFPIGTPSLLCVIDTSERIILIVLCCSLFSWRDAKKSWEGLTLHENGSFCCSEHLTHFSRLIGRQCFYSIRILLLVSNCTWSAECAEFASNVIEVVIGNYMPFVLEWNSNLKLLAVLESCNHYTPKYNLKDRRNITKLIHRPEKGLNLKSECILVSAMVHLPQEWNFGSPTIMEKWW